MAIGAACSNAEGASLGAPQGPISEHGLQFRFNEITYFLEHLFIGYAVLKWSNLEFTFEVGGSLVATDAMFLEPCHKS